MLKFISTLINRKIALFAAIILFLIIFMSLFASVITVYDPMDFNPIERLQRPNMKNWFGTDQFGRDIYTRIVYGTRMTFISGLGVVVFATIVGTFIGVISAYFKKIDYIMMRLVDVMMAFPSLILALVLMTIMGRGLLNVIIAVGVVYITRTARIIYGLTLKIKTETYVTAALAVGATNKKIITKYILPNLISPIIVQATFTFAFSLLQMAALDFLGLGLPPQIPSWGNMVSEGRMFITRAPWLLLFPGIFIVLAVLSFNIFGDFLRDKMDPRYQNEMTQNYK